MKSQSDHHHFFGIAGNSQSSQRLYAPKGTVTGRITRSMALTAFLGWDIVVILSGDQWTIPKQSPLTQYPRDSMPLNNANKKRKLAYQIQPIWLVIKMRRGFKQRWKVGNHSNRHFQTFVDVRELQEEQSVVAFLHTEALLHQISLQQSIPQI